MCQAHCFRGLKYINEQKEKNYFSFCRTYILVEGEKGNKKINITYVDIWGGEGQHVWSRVKRGKGYLLGIKACRVFLAIEGT